MKSRLVLIVIFVTLWTTGAGALGGEFTAYMELDLMDDAMYYTVMARITVDPIVEDIRGFRISIDSDIDDWGLRYLHEDDEVFGSELDDGALVFARESPIFTTVELYVSGLKEDGIPTTATITALTNDGWGEEAQLELVAGEEVRESSEPASEQTEGEKG